MPTNGSVSPLLSRLVRREAQSHLVVNAFNKNFVSNPPNPVIFYELRLITFVGITAHSMKLSLHTRLLCCTLALLVLASSVGIGMVDHWCHMRGHTKTFLLAKRSCQKPCQASEAGTPLSGQRAVKRMACCKTTLWYAHLDVSRFVADHHVTSAPQPAEFIPNPQFRLLLAALLPSPSTELLLPFSQPPLPRTGRFRLTTNCTWLI